MQNTSLLYKEIVNGLHHFETALDIYTSDGQTIVSSFGENRLVSLNTKRSLFSEEKFSVGCCVSGEITVSFYPTDQNDQEIVIPRMAMIIPKCRAVSSITGDYSDWIQKGVFFVDTRNKDKVTGLLTLHGYDAMLKTEADYPENSSINFPAYDIRIVEEIADAMGCDVDPRTYDIITGDYEIGLPLGYSQREVLSGVSASYGANFCISDQGKLLAISSVGILVTNGYLIDKASGQPITFGGVRILV